MFLEAAWLLFLWGCQQCTWFMPVKSQCEHVRASADPTASFGVPQRARAIATTARLGPHC